MDWHLDDFLHFEIAFGFVGSVLVSQPNRHSGGVSRGKGLWLWLLALVTGDRCVTGDKLLVTHDLVWIFFGATIHTCKTKKIKINIFWHYLLFFAFCPC